MDPVKETLSFVRGDQDWRSLAKIGISILVRDDQVSVMGQLSSPILATARDVASGWLRHAGRSDELRMWAQVLMGAVGIIELDLQDTGDEDALKEALWTVSFGGPATVSMEKLARRILLTSERNHTA